MTQNHKGTVAQPSLHSGPWTHKPEPTLDGEGGSTEFCMPSGPWAGVQWNLESSASSRDTLWPLPPSLSSEKNKAVVWTVHGVQPLAMKGPICKTIFPQLFMSHCQTPPRPFWMSQALTTYLPLFWVRKSKVGQKNKVLDVFVLLNYSFAFLSLKVMEIATSFCLVKLKQAFLYSFCLVDASLRKPLLLCCNHKRLFYFLSLYLIIWPTFCPAWDSCFRFLTLRSLGLFKCLPCFLK